IATPTRDSNTSRATAKATVTVRLDCLLRGRALACSSIRPNHANTAGRMVGLQRAFLSRPRRRSCKTKIEMTADTDVSLAEHLRELEKLLANPEIRKSPAELARLIADDFREFGGSGRIFDKQQIIA